MARPSDSIELEALFEDTLAEATQTRDFGKMIEKLTPEACHPKAVVEPMSWRFANMPYGRDNADTKTFPDNGIDSPHGAGGLSVVNMDLGSVGDYVERVDNKPNPIRKARHMYTAAYVPPTK